MPSTSSSTVPGGRDLVLVGGGHAHIEVLRRLALERPPGLTATLVTEGPVALYSGMVPGLVAGQYVPGDLEIDLAILARQAGVELISSPMTGLDPQARQVFVQGDAIAYRVASLDIGSTVAGGDLPGVSEHALATRPLSRFVARVQGCLEAVPADGLVRVVVVGGGAAGMELAFALRARLGRTRQRLAVTVYVSGPVLLPGSSPALAARVRRRASAAGIALRHGLRAIAAEAGSLRLDDGTCAPFDLLVWATGAVAHPLLRASRLPTNEAGFVLVRPSLQVIGFDDLFAAGDCATLARHPELPKAGVYAVRQGPVLHGNLMAALAGRALRAYSPQRDFLVLLNLGDGSAAGGKWRLAFEGRWVFRFKDWIDRRFLARYRA